MTHAEAMKEASKSWPKEKKKIERRLKKCQKSASTPPQQRNQDVENDQQ